jgi:hypothetical protein
MSRTIICEDSLVWLNKQTELDNVVTGICDQNEMDNVSIDEYIVFFESIADLIFSKLKLGCYAIFIQTDRKYNRTWIDKSYLLTSIAKKYGLKTVWHKIVLNRPVNSTHLQRPTYAHMLAYTKEMTSGSATPDVIESGGKLYSNGTSINAATVALNHVKRYSKNPNVIDPFVGRGTIASIGNKLGLNVTGIDIDEKQCELASLAK